LQDPGRPLPGDIVALTGLNDADLAGRRIDWTDVRQRLDGAALVIAHNARFDRGFVDRVLPGPPPRHVWACSASQLDWETCGSPSRSQEVLEVWHGWFALRAHRALDDADNLLFLLEHAGRLAELYRNATTPWFRLRALNSAYETKDLLKARGYRWDGEGRCWWTELPTETAAQEEVVWATSAVYGGRFRGDLTRLEAWQRFLAVR